MCVCVCVRERERERERERFTESTPVVHPERLFQRAGTLQETERRF